MYYRNVTHGDNCKQGKLKVASINKQQQPQVPWRLSVWTFLTKFLEVLKTKVNSFREQFLLKRECSCPFLNKKVSTTTTGSPNSSCKFVVGVFTFRIRFIDCLSRYRRNLL